VAVADAPTVGVRGLRVVDGFVRASTPAVATRGTGGGHMGNLATAGWVDPRSRLTSRGSKAGST